MNTLHFEQKLRKIKYPIKPVNPNSVSRSQLISVKEYNESCDQYKRDLEAYKEAVDKYHEQERKIENEFKTWAIKEAGIEKVENKEDIYNYAWREGHSEGFSNVFNILLEIVRLIEGCKVLV
jgi:hypothetical protein